MLESGRGGDVKEGGELEHSDQSRGPAANLPVREGGKNFRLISINPT